MSAEDRLGAQRTEAEMDAARSVVLVVDDDPTARRMLDVRLRALGCRVVTAANGREALAAIAHERPALMLLDLQMPEMDGMEVLRTLKREGIAIATIVITAHGSPDTATEAQQAGALGFFAKPYAMQDFDIAVRRVLGRGQLRLVNH
jgi:DNA-binding NtrC family response regulator